MSLALFGFDELEAKLYFLNTGKHISENLLSPPRGDNESSSSSNIMDEESISNCDVQMEEDIDDSAKDGKKATDVVVDSNARMTEDISDDDSLTVDGELEDMEVTQDPKQEDGAKSPEKHVRFALGDETKDQMVIAENVGDEVVVEKGDCPEAETKASSHLNTDFSKPMDDVNSEITCQSTEVNDDVPSLTETPCLSSQEGESGEGKTSATTPPPETIAEQESNTASRTDHVSNDVLSTKQVSNDEEAEPDGNFAQPRSPTPTEPAKTETSSHNNNNLTSSPDDIAANCNVVLGDSNGLNDQQVQAAEVLEQIQHSCKQCYVKLYKMQLDPVIETPANLLKSCKNCYVRLNKLHINDLLLSCRQCSVVVPKLALHVRN